MVKAGLLGFTGRRKSHGNVMDDVKPLPAPDAGSGTESPSGGGGGFRLMSTTEAEARKTEEKRRAQEKAASKFRPFSSFSAGNKSRNRSFDEESPGSSKRDSKSSSGTQSSRPYNNGQFGSTSTLPSSTDMDDNLFAIPRPQIPSHNSSPSGLSANTYHKQLPPPPSESRWNEEPSSPVAGIGRVRAMTSSSYASTAKPPALDTDMNFGSTNFDDLFSGIDRKPSPEHAAESPGRSLLAGKRTFHAEPIKIDPKREVEAPLKSWDSRNSTDNLMSSPSPDEDDSPPPVPPHKHGQYAPVASYSPELNASNDFVDHTASLGRPPVIPQKSQRERSPEQKPTSISSSVPSLETPLSSRSGSDMTTPKAALRGTTPLLPENGEDSLFASPNQKQRRVPAPTLPAPKAEPRPRTATTDSGRRVLTEAEYLARQQRAMEQQYDSNSDGSDYEDDEDEAQERAAQEAMARRKKQQLDLAREHMRRTTTAPGALNRPDSVNEPFTMGFPSETSLQADEWEDEDIPLGILAQHGFPSRNLNKAPTQPANAIPSYFPDRPASAGPSIAGDRASTFRPVFARNLPDDPHASFIGGGLVRPTNRESMGFGNRGPASIAGDSVSSMNMPMMGYPEPQLSAPSLVEQIHMRDMSKQKYMGGASTKRPQEGPFTGMLGSQMNPPVQAGPGTRMSMMPGMQGMGMGMNMMGGQMGGQMGMPMMGGQMAYPMQQNDMNMQMQQMQQMQQMIAAQQMQIQQMQMQQAQDPRMSMAFPSNMSNMSDPRMSMAFPHTQMPPPPQPDRRMSMATSSFLNVPSAQRPMSMMPAPNLQTPPPRPFSTPMGGAMGTPPPPSGYTPSIAPSERSNVGLSARYRPVATHADAKSSSSMTMTLQASGGAAQNSATVKATLKPKAAAKVDGDDDDGWGKMAARKSKFLGGGVGAGGAHAGKGSVDTSLSDLVRSLDRL